MNASRVPAAFPSTSPSTFPLILLAGFLLLLCISSIGAQDSSGARGPGSAPVSDPLPGHSAVDPPPASVSPMPSNRSASDAGEFPPDAPDRYIGLTLPEAYLILGVPAGVANYRGEEPWQDDVIFSYESRLSLFWFRNRVWQVRLDSGYPGEFIGIRMGYERERIRGLLGKPIRVEDDWDLFSLADRGYPVRARFFYQSGRLIDAYLYRGDF